MEELTIRETGGKIAAQQTITAELFGRWTSYLDAKPKTVQTYTRNIKPFVQWLSLRGISQPQREDIIAYREELRQTRKPSTVQAYLQALKLFFQWTEQEGLYPNIAERVKGAKIDQEHKKDYLTSSQAAAVLDTVDRSTAKGLRDYAILSLMVTSGIRTVEVIRADIGDLHTVADFTALFVQGKGHDQKSDYIKIAAPVEAAIRAYLKTRPGAAAGDPLFSSEAHRNGGGRMTTRSISRIVKGHFLEAGLNSDRLTAHSLRHTAATLNLLNGGTVEETRQLLRHTNINTTLIYSHALERAKNNSEDRIASAIFK